MHKRFSRSGLNKFLNQQPSGDETAGSHAYGKVSRYSRSVPRVRSTRPSGRQSVAGYRDSMVGSTVQYRDKLPPMTPKPDTTDKTAIKDKNIIGNRPQSNTISDKAEAKKKHHFSEPTKRNFYRFD